MMKSMITENGVTFKELEKNIFQWVCQIGQEFTKEFLERYDQQLMKQRDKNYYRHKGLRQTTIKTVYGEVTYQRAIYEAFNEDGSKRFVYLLDEMLDLDHVGLISTNMAELLVSGITEMSYRECAAKVSQMTGQNISAMGVWNVIQALGEKVCEEEKELTEAHKLSAISFDDMLEMAAQGAKVLHDRSVELAKSHSLPFEVRSSFADVPGTVVGPQEARRFCGIAVQRGLSLPPVLPQSLYCRTASWRYPVPLPRAWD